MPTTTRRTHATNKNRSTKLTKRRRKQSAKKSAQTLWIEYQRLLQETARLNLPPLDAAKYLRKLRDGEG
jgi:hypothetical protein